MFNKYMQAFIMGKKDPLKDWDAYVKEADDKGIQQLVKLLEVSVSGKEVPYVIASTHPNGGRWEGRDCRDKNENNMTINQKLVIYFDKKAN